MIVMMKNVVVRDINKLRVNLRNAINILKHILYVPSYLIHTNIATYNYLFILWHTYMVSY